MDDHHVDDERTEEVGGRSRWVERSCRSFVFPPVSEAL